MNVRISVMALVVLGLAACVAPGPRYSDAYDDRAYASGDRRYAEDYRDDAYRSGGYRNFSSCANCGRVQRIEGYSDSRRSSGGGAAVGAIIGGVIGNQIGSGSGRSAATVAGAVGGGIVGHNIEGNRQHASYDITVRLNTRRTVVVSQDRIDGMMREGSRVIVHNGRVQLL